MAILNLTAYKPVAGTLGDAGQIDNAFDAIVAVVNNLDNNNFGAGKIFDLTKLMQGAAATGSLMRWDGANWAKTTNTIVDDANSKITFAADTSLYRAAAGQLKTDTLFIGGAQVYSQPGTNVDGFVYNPGGGGVGGYALTSTLQGETNPRWRVKADGTITWGAGGASATDTSFYRGAANKLGTDGGLYAWYGTANEISIDRWGPGSEGAIRIGGDSKIWRSAASTLKTDSIFVGTSQIYTQVAGGATGFVYNPAVAGGIAFQSIVQGAANNLFNFDSNGKMNWGPGGGTATDTSLARTAAGTLKLDTSAATIKIDFAGLTNLYANAASILTTDGGLVAAGNISALLAVGDTQPQIVLSRNFGGAGLPGIAFGPGGATAPDVSFYRSAAHRLFMSDLVDATTMSVAIKTKAGAPVDGDWAVAPPVGTMVYDSINVKFWIRTAAATWKGVVIA